VTALPAASTEDFAHDSAALGRRKLVQVAAPPRVGPETPVLVLLHPFAGNRTAWPRHAPGLLAGLARDTLVAMPECGRRWFIDDHAGVPYGRYVVEDLLPALRAGYGAGGPAAIGGFSAGGAAAAFFALRRPDVFGAALAAAGAFTAAGREGDPYADVRTDDLMIPTEAEHDRVWGPPGSPTRAAHDLAALVAALPRDTAPPAIHIDVGASDFPRMLAATETLATLLADAGVPHTVTRSPGDHSWDYAARAMPALAARWRERLA
jgi:putative tributyrin esterase